MLRPSPHLFALSMLLLVACGGKSNAEDDGGGSSGGSAGGGSSNVGGKSSAGQATGGSSVGGGSSVCEGFEDDPGYQLPVMIVNETTSTLHVGAEMGNCGFVPLFEVADAQGTPLPQPGDCRQACEQVMQSGPLGCPAICRFPSAVTLAPGESVIELWSGLVTESQMLPASCIPPELGGDSWSCTVARQIQPGTYTFSAQAGSDVDCSMASGGPCSDCMPSSRGGCTTPGVIVGELRQAEVTVDLGPAYGVYETARPADPGPGSGSGAAGGMIATVTIVFRD